MPKKQHKKSGPSVDQLDTDTLAKEDIAARPPVTGEGAIHGAMDGMNGATDAASVTAPAVEIDLEPNRLEKASAGIIVEALAEIRGMFGWKENKKLNVLLEELFGAGMSGVKNVTGKPWLSLAYALGAVCMCCVPPYLRYVISKKSEGNPQDEGTA